MPFHFPPLSLFPLPPHPHPHPPTQAFLFLSRGSTAGSACLPKATPLSHVKPGSAAEEKKKKKGNEVPKCLIQANSPRRLGRRGTAGDATVFVNANLRAGVCCSTPAKENCNPGRTCEDICVASSKSSCSLSAQGHVRLTSA